VYGTVCTVVWEGGAARSLPIPIGGSNVALLAEKAGWGFREGQLPRPTMTSRNSQLPRLMTVLNAGRFARSGVGHCPETPHNWECRHVLKRPKGYGPVLSSHVESGELAGGERPGAHIAIAKSVRHFIRRIRQDDVVPILQTYAGTALGSASCLLCRDPIFIPQVNSVADLNDTA